MDHAIDRAADWLPAEKPADLSPLRALFPTLRREFDGRPLVYLDTAATSLRPEAVIEAEARFYRDHNASAHRGLYQLAEEATELYEGARARAAKWLGLSKPESVVFTRNATAGLNTLARGIEHRLEPGDEVLLTQMEHHSNLVPWIQLARRLGITLRHIPLKADFTLDLDAARRLIGPKTRILSLTHVSNVLGTINPVAELAEMGHQVGARVIVDAAQSAGHLPLSFESLGADFLVISAHKCYGPMGLGLLVGRLDALELLEPSEGGGQMIDEVSFDHATWAPVPQRFEAGTANVAAATAFSHTIELMETVGADRIREHELDLSAYAWTKLGAIDGLSLIGPSSTKQRGGLVSFVDADIHPHDMATLIAEAGVALRAGHQCAQPLHRLLEIPATLRASFGLYTTRDDIDALVDAIGFARRFMAR